MKQFSLTSYANNEIRFGWDELPYTRRGDGRDNEAQLTATRDAITVQAVHERFIDENKLFEYRDEDGVYYRGNMAQGYESSKGVLSELDIIPKLQDTSKEGDASTGTDYTLPVRDTVFTRNARHRLLEAGACFDSRLSGEFRGHFATLTLPGGTQALFDGVARWSGYVCNRLTQVLRDASVGYWFWCWELQGRGALHLHLFFALDSGITGCDVYEGLRGTWYRALEHIGRQEGFCPYQHREGDFCTIRKYWQTDFQLVSKSPAAYISKYVSKNAYTTKPDRDSLLESWHPPRRWWSMSRSFTRMIEEERFHVCVEAINDDHVCNLMSAMEDVCNDAEPVCSYEYCAELKTGGGVDRHPVGTTVRKVFYFDSNVFQDIRIVIERYFLSLVNQLSDYRKRFKYGSLHKFDSTNVPC